MSHVAWNCDGKKLAAVGIDKVTRIWQPEKSMELRAASLYSGGHSDDVDHISWNPTHPELFCTSSQKDRKVVFWDARQSRCIQQCPLKVSPVQTGYTPDGRTLFYVSAGHYLSFMELGKEPSDPKESWRIVEKEQPITASQALFNHAGDGLVVSFYSEHSLRVFTYPGLIIQETPAAHVGGCVAMAQDPRGRYVASGGHDSIVNLFDVAEWITARTIVSCDHAITSLSFSHDGEYLAISSESSYIDICATETAVPLHRVPTLGPVPSVSWHPSKHVIAYCGQTKIREGGPAPSALVSLFGAI